MYAIIKQIETDASGNEVVIEALCKLGAQSVVSDKVKTLKATDCLDGYKMLDGSEPPSLAERLLEHSGIAADASNGIRAFRRLLEQYELQAAYQQRADAIRSAVEKLGEEATADDLFAFAFKSLEPGDAKRKDKQ